MSDWLAIISIIIELIKKAGGLLKPKGKLKEIAENPEFQQQFLKQNGNNVVINVKGDLYLGDLSKIPSNVDKELLSGLEDGGAKEQKKNVNFFHVDFYPRVIKFSNTQLTDENIDKCLKYIKSVDILNLFKMSKYVQVLYNEGNGVEANEARSNIGDQYGKFGRKFCNLYQQKYIHLFVDYLLTRFEDKPKELKESFESEFLGFLMHSDTIFFIHEDMDVKTIIFQCIRAMDREEPYIALHAGNKKNIKCATSILSQIREHATEKSYHITEENIQTKTKTLLLNIYITKELQE